MFQKSIVLPLLAAQALLVVSSPLGERSRVRRYYYNEDRDLNTRSRQPNNNQHLNPQNFGMATNGQPNNGQNMVTSTNGQPAFGQYPLGQSGPGQNSQFGFGQNGFGRPQNPQRPADGSYDQGRDLYRQAMTSHGQGGSRQGGYQQYGY